MNAKHETRDADVGSLFLIAVILVLGGGIIYFSVWALMHLLATKEPPARDRLPPSSRAVSPPSEPRLETQAGIALEQSRRREEAQLHSYGWIDRNSGLAHIPIDRAIELILRRGLPDVGGGQTPLQLMQARSQEARPSPVPR
jgi:hypothetical protein